MKLPPTSSSIVAAVRSLGPAALNLSCECTRATFSVARAPEMVSRLFKEAVGQLQKSLRVGGAAENPRSIARERLQAMVAVHRNAAAVSGVNFHALQADMIQCIKVRLCAACDCTPSASHNILNRSACSCLSEFLHLTL